MILFRYLYPIIKRYGFTVQEDVILGVTETTSLANMPAGYGKCQQKR